MINVKEQIGILEEELALIPNATQENRDTIKRLFVEYICPRLEILGENDIMDVTRYIPYPRFISIVQLVMLGELTEPEFEEILNLTMFKLPLSEATKNKIDRKVKEAVESAIVELTAQLKKG